MTQSILPSRAVVTSDTIVASVKGLAFVNVNVFGQQLKIMGYAQQPGDMCSLAAATEVAGELGHLPVGEYKPADPTEKVVYNAGETDKIYTVTFADGVTVYAARLITMKQAGNPGHFEWRSTHDPYWKVDPNPVVIEAVSEPVDFAVEFRKRLEAAGPAAFSPGEVHAIVEIGNVLAEIARLRADLKLPV